MTWRELDLEDGQLGKHSAAWDALNLRLFRAHPFADSRFVNGLLRHFGSAGVRLFAHGTHAACNGMLLIERRRPAVWRPFLPAQLQASPLLVECAEHLRELMSLLPGPVVAIECHRQDPRFSSARVADTAPTCRIDHYATTMEVALQGTFEGYWAGRPKKLVQNLRRYQKRSETDIGPSEFVVIDRTADMRAAVERYGVLETSGWKSKSGTAVSIDNSQGRFYADLLEAFSATNQARIYELWLGGRLAASRLVASGAGMHIMLKTAYDEAMAAVAPGRLLLHRVLEHMHAERGQETVEFYTDASPDQLAWATGSRPIVHATHFRWAWVTSAFDAYQRRRRRPSAA